MYMVLSAKYQADGSGDVDPTKALLPDMGSAEVWPTWAMAVARVPSMKTEAATLAEVTEDFIKVICFQVEAG